MRRIASLIVAASSANKRRLTVASAAGRFAKNPGCSCIRASWHSKIKVAGAEWPMLMVQGAYFFFQLSTTSVANSGTAQHSQMMVTPRSLNSGMMALAKAALLIMRKKKKPSVTT